MSTLVKSSQTNRNQVRLNKFLASAGIASRRKCDELIAGGRVRVNHRVVKEMGVRIDPDHDAVTVDGRYVTLRGEPVYLLLNKPKDCITTAKDEKGRRTVFDYVRIRTRVFPVGRLDRNTTGVLLLTNDGEFAHRLMHPAFEIPKSYEVTLKEPAGEAELDRLRKGIPLDDGWTASCEAFLLPRSQGKKVGIIIHEGRNRQVIRMFEHLGHTVIHLHRVAYGRVTLEGLARGKWRYLSGSEINDLKKLTDPS